MKEASFAPCFALVNKGAAHAAIEYLSLMNTGMAGTKPSGLSPEFDLCAFVVYSTWTSFQGTRCSMSRGFGGILCRAKSGEIS